MDYSSIQGGAKGCSSLVGADLSDLTAAGSMDESLVLLSGDVVEAAEALVSNLESELPKVVSIGIIGDETEEAKKIVENFPSLDFLYLLCIFFAISKVLSEEPFSAIVTIQSLSTLSSMYLYLH